ncbi:MAG: glycosyltransferase family 2 protein [Deltaproteobacteria bacterium]|nr:glycosyltransferase family 2 protein [Deltaproteobacteria bacterium]MBW2383483.1 glycosyltransferase family 2 protein [Deltaproteobacteria bacterium]MBW2697145.1 glycosyltransferase family 2 protein [Deltaproteobacteria bacterium]
MQRDAKVSILLPVHNAVSTLPVCLRSLARQTETAWHCVAVDDGSTDASLDLLRAAAAQDPRFEVVATPHGGLVAALRTGLARCGAPLVARMDADDVMHRHRLEAQREMLDAAPQLAAAGARVRIFPRAGLRDGRRAYETWLNALGDSESVRRDAFVECPVAHPTLMIRRNVIESFGYRETAWAEDYDLVLRLLAAGEEIAIHPRRLLGWRDSPGRLSRTAPEYRPDRFTDCKAAHLASGFLEATSRYLLWGYGDTGRTLRRALARHDRTPSHIVELHPRRLGQRIHGAPVIHPDELRKMRPGRLVVSVAGAKARGLIRGELATLGWVDGRDFICAA